MRKYKKSEITGQPLSKVLEYLQNGEVVVMPIIGLSKFLLSIPTKMKFAFVATIEKNQVLIQQIPPEDIYKNENQKSEKVIEINLN